MSCWSIIRIKGGITGMIRLFVTGDNHIGRKYDRYGDVKEQLIQSRLECMRDMVRQAELEKCDFFVITGDLFDNVNSVRVGDVKHVVDILAEYSGRVLIIPGNHDYYTGNEKVWQDFEKALDKKEHNITLLNEFRKYSFDAGDDNVDVYPAFCQAKHSETNNLEWIRQSDIQTSDIYNIGIAHGALKGVTPDINEEYYMMTEKELDAIPVDVWLLGHTHITYPGVIGTDEDVIGYRIYNPGTHEQTDINNNTEGNCFIVSLDKKKEEIGISAHRYVSGKVRYYDIQVSVQPDSDRSLEDAIKGKLADIDYDSVVKLYIEGAAGKNEYDRRQDIYSNVLGNYLFYDVIDSELNEEISAEKIREEYAETSFAYSFLSSFIDEPVELGMAYQLVKECCNENQNVR